MLLGLRARRDNRFNRSGGEMKVVTGLRWVERNAPCIDRGFYGKGNRPKMSVLQQQLTTIDTTFRGLFNSEPAWEDVPTHTDSTGGSE